MNKKIVFLLLVALISLPQLAAAQAGLTVSPVAACINDDTDTTCANMIAVNLGVSYGVEALLNVPYIDTVTTVGGDTTTTLEENLVFEISKTEPTLVYPLRLSNIAPSSLSFQAYQIDSPRRSYTVTASIFKDTTLMTSFGVSPDFPIYLDKTSVHQVKMQLAGEDKPAIAPPDLSNYILFFYRNYVFLVPWVMVPVDGAATAATNVATMLNGLLSQDLALMSNNPYGARYLVSGMKMFQGAPLPNTNNLSLQVMSPEVSYSTVSLEIDPAQVSSVINEAQGYIMNAYVVAFDSMSKNGTMVVDVRNSGNSKTNYIVTVTNCTGNIVGPIPAQAVTMTNTGPGASATLQFDVATATNSDSSHNCLVTLMAPTGLVFDSVTVYFDTNLENH